ncbi:hypothetical protein O1611_g3951 [Lasiodiplodia mahajangana]|uniref:Uncharacterized protein n=1 Tax=Lasiodiplodia mahajangana TaxID=1108764 RepID=A0ACC2JQ94_9PEZI|nr:hypothetical protein O1611_g3951 [Lasiodiplodia mahajangana]
MATSREERMQQRMRGAGRHEVADDSFGFVLPAAEPSPGPSPTLSQPRSEPNTSAKRRKLNNGDNEFGSATSQPSSPSVATRSSARLSSGQKPAQIDAIPQIVVRRLGSLQRDSPPATAAATRISARLDALNLNPDGTPRDGTNDDTPGGLPAADTTMGEAPDHGDLPDLPEPSIRRSSRGSRGSEASRQSNVSMMDLVEEVTESPVSAPGSGRRRRVERPDPITQSVKLQRVVMEAEQAGFTGEVASSSPLARKTRRSTTTSSRFNIHPPLARRSLRSNSTGAAGSVRSTRSQHRPSALSTVAFDAEQFSSPPDAAGINSPRKAHPRRKVPETIHESPYEIPESEEENEQAGEEAEVEAEANDEEVEEVEEAEEVDDHEAAQRIGRKRPRASPRRKQPPEDVDEVDSPTVTLEQPAKRRRPRQKKISPAKQAQPKAAKERKKKPFTRRKSDGNSIPVTVQRYTKPLRHNEDGADEGILNADIPFTDHKSPNVVDLVLQMCEESLEKYLSTLHGEASQADGPANRKAFRTKLRVVEAFQEELRTQLQTQTIALDNLRTLKKRVRAAQKEKLALRNEILRIRSEREQVALKIDAVRERHETATQQSLHQLGLSSTMDDIELAIENGRMAPELGPKEEKMAELANLDLLISQITNQVSVAGDGGGTLKQIKDFNMFLERAAVALEGR